MRYPNCQRADGDCTVCSLSSYGKDCRGAPANKITYLRTRAGLTQGGLASASGINIRMVQYLESGERKVENTTLKTAIALADALGVDPRDLL